MKQKNKYAYRSHISERKFREFLRCFTLDITADKIAILTNINRNTVNKYIMLIRIRIARLCLDNPSSPKGVFEVDESYFGGRFVKGKKGRGAGGKIKVFGILKRGGKVYTEIVPDCSSKTLQGVIRGKINPGSVVNSDGWKAGACPHENGGWFGRYWLRQTLQSNPQ